MKKITVWVSVGDSVEEVADFLKDLSVDGVRVSITRQTQVNDLWTPNGASVSPFEGTMADVLEYLSDRCRAATGYPNSERRCKFVFPTIIEIVK